MAVESRGRPPVTAGPQTNTFHAADGGAPAIVEAPGKRTAVRIEGLSFLGHVTYHARHRSAGAVVDV